MTTPIAHPVAPPAAVPWPDRERRVEGWGAPALLLGAVTLVAFFFAKVEVQIEGDAGWAASLPTWKIESHWLLDMFWGGRPMTGYHAWVFSFMALIFHLPMAVLGRWTPRLEARVLGALMWFWILEDFLWFVINPAFGLAKFGPATIWWHKHWLWVVPTDYVTFTVVGTLLLTWSYRRPTPTPAGTSTVSSAPSPAPCAIPVAAVEAPASAGRPGLPTAAGRPAPPPDPTTDQA